MAVRLAFFWFYFYLQRLIGSLRPHIVSMATSASNHAIEPTTDRANAHVFHDANLTSPATSALASGGPSCSR